MANDAVVRAGDRAGVVVVTNPSNKVLTTPIVRRIRQLRREHPRMGPKRLSLALFAEGIDVKPSSLWGPLYQGLWRHVK